MPELNTQSTPPLPSDAVPPNAALRVEGETWVVVPAYNEGERLAKTLQGITAACSHVVVVDDGSRDHTSEVARRFPRVWILRHPINCGQGAALQTGIDFALSQGAGVIVTIDADGQHSPEEMNRLVAPIRSGQYDVVLGSRFLGATDGMPFSRSLMLKLGVLFTRFFSRIRVTDTHNGYRALSRKAAEKIRIRLNRMAHASEILDQIVQHHLRYCEAPVTIRYTSATLEKGQSSWNGFRIVGQLIMSRIVK